MKIKNIIFGSILVLIIFRIYFFIFTIKLSEEIKILDYQIKKLREENLTLEKEISKIDSFQFAATSASALGFSKIAETIPLENLKYARKN
jgi:cell division protein FtsL